MKKMCGWNLVGLGIAWIVLGETMEYSVDRNASPYLIYGLLIVGILIMVDSIRTWAACLKK